MASIDCGFDNAHGWFRLRAAAIILEQGCVLLAQNVKDRYYYSIGGAVHLQESAEEAVRRECLEETGIPYEIDRLCFIHQNFFHDAADRPFHEVAFYYLMKPRGDLRLQRHDVSMYGDTEHAVWVPLAQLPRVYAFPVFFRDRLQNLPDAAEVITTRESREEHLKMTELVDSTTAFLPTDDLADGVIRLNCQYRMERDPERRFVPSYCFDIALEAGGETAGICVLRVGDEDTLDWAGNIGYEILPAYRGRGLAVRACQLLYRLAKAQGLPSVTITCDPGNLASARVAEKTGSVYVRTAAVPEGHPLWNDGLREVRIYRKTLG